MRKLTEEDANNIPYKPSGKMSIARLLLTNMKIRDIILLEKSEWKNKSNSPTELIRRMRKEDKRDYTCQTALDGSGWIIKRIK